MLGKLFNNKPVTIVMAFFISVILWFYVAGVYNPDTSDTFRNVQVVVEYTGSVPESMNLVPTDDTIQMVDVKVNGPRVLLATMAKEKIVAKADLSAVNKVGSYPIPIDIKFPPGQQIELVSVEPQNITMNFDLKSTVVVPVKVDVTGKVNDKLLVGTIQTTPQQITVTGPESILKTIENAVTTIDVSDITTTQEIKTSFILTDKDNNQINMSSITTDFETVNITVPILLEKEIPLLVDLINASGGSDAGFADIKITPKTITISGSEDAINAVNNVYLGKIDTSKIIKSKSETFPVILPNDVNNVNKIVDVKVTVSLKEFVTKSLTIRNIEIRNSPPGRTVSTVTKSVTIKLRGLPADISAITADQIKAVIDLQNSETISKGRITRQLTFELPTGVNVGVNGAYDAIINVK